MHLSIRLLSFVAALIGPTAALANPVLPRNLNEEVVMLSLGSGLFETRLETTLFRPPGSGPFPLVVINHGKESGNPRFQQRARYLAASREFAPFRQRLIAALSQAAMRSQGSMAELPS